MSLELHRSARRDQALAAGQPAEPGTPAERDSPTAPGAFGAGSAPDTRSDSGATAEPSAPDATSAQSGSGAPSAPDTGSPSGATAEPSAPDATSAQSRSDAPSASGAAARPSASAEASDPAVSEPARDAAPGGSPPAGGRLDESSVDLDGPLLADAAGLRANWHRVQTRFVDDPREAVADAASLVEHTAQALVGALRQRQQLLRATWDRDRSTDGLGAPAGGSPESADPAASGQQATEGAPDTEQLRLLMHRYRDLFNHICQP